MSRRREPARLPLVNRGLLPDENGRGADSAYRLGGAEAAIRFVAGLEKGAQVMCPACPDWEPGMIDAGSGYAHSCYLCVGIPKAVNRELKELQLVGERPAPQAPGWMHQVTCAEALEVSFSYIGSGPGKVLQRTDLTGYLKVRGIR